MKSDRVLIILSVCLALTTAFSEVPVSQEVPVGTEVVFRCQHTNADIIRWRVNGSSIGRNPPADITPGTTRDEEGNLVDTLTIVARREYNGTTIECVAQFDDRTPDESSEPPAMLLIQGVQTSSPIPTTTPTTPGFQEFTLFPTSKNVTLETVAVFHCRYPTARVIDWIVNGTSLKQSSPGLNITASGDTSTLSITAQSEFNSTEIQCEAFFRDAPSQMSDTAILMIQGLLSNVTNLVRVNSTTISWEPPFSLDLTDVDPDIVYCVEVYNVTDCEKRELLTGDCNVTETNYTIPYDVGSGQNDIYEYIVTPRSNVEESVNGTESLPLKSHSLNFTVNKPSLKPKNENITDHITKLSFNENDLPVPSNYTLDLKSVDGVGNGKSVKIVARATLNEALRVLSLRVCQLDRARLWRCVILANGCSNYELLLDQMEVYLSTHDIQEVHVTSPGPGEVSVDGYFIEHSNASGVLVITTDGSDTSYHFIDRDSDRLNGDTKVLRLPGGEYTVSVFVVKEDGVAVERAAAIPMNRTVANGGFIDGTTNSMDYVVQSTSTGVCITCTFLESSTATDCVAVVHQRISQLNSSAGLMNIESSHKFARSGDTASGCIEGVNLVDYQVGVVGVRLLDPASNSEVCRIECVSASVSAVIITVVFAPVVIVIVYMCNGRKRRQKSNHRIRARLMNVELGLSTNHCDIVDQQDEKKQENTPLVQRVQTDGCGSGVEQLQPTSLTTRFEEATFTTSPVTPSRADEEVCLPGAVPEPAYADPALVKQSVSIPPATERSTYSNVEKFQNPQGLTYALLEHISQKQHNPQPDDCYTAKSEYSEVVIMKDECCKAKGGEDNKKKVAPQSVPPPTPCDIENLCKLLYPISYKWEKFAKALPLDEDHIDDINTGNETDEACLQEVLERYKINGDFKHNWEEIVAILRGVDEQLADKIHDLHVYPYKSSRSGQAQDMEDSNTQVNHQDTENEGEKNEVVDSTHCEDGHCAALNSDDEGFNDTEKEEPPELEGDIMTPVQESGVSVSTEPNHPISQDCGSLEVPTDINEALKLACVLNQTDSKRSDPKPKHFYSIRRQDSENSDSGLVSDNNPIISGSEKQSMYIYGDNVYLAGGGSTEFCESGYHTTACHQEYSSCHSTDSFVDNITTPDVTPTTPTRSRREHQRRYLINKKVGGSEFDSPPCQHTQGTTLLDRKPADFVTVMPKIAWDGAEKDYMPCGGAAIYSGSPSDMLGRDSQKNLLVEKASSPILVTEQPKSSVQLQLAKETLKSSDNVDEVSQHSCTSSVGKNGGRSTPIPLDSAYVSERAEHRT